MLAMASNMKQKFQSLGSISPTSANGDRSNTFDSPNSKATTSSPATSPVATVAETKTRDTIMMAALTPPSGPTTPPLSDNMTMGVHELPKLGDTKTTSNFSAVLERSKTIMNVEEDCLLLPDNLPFSTIVWGERFDPYDIEKRRDTAKKIKLRTEARIKVRDLFSKYIVVGSELELNLSHRLRSRMVQKLGYLDKMVDKELEQLSNHTVFDWLMS